MSGRVEVWSTRRLLVWTTDYFTRKHIDSPRLSAEMLLAHVLHVPRLKLYTDPDRPASELERAAFRELVERAVAHEPVDYLVGQAPFFSMMFEVNRGVLIPRPSTQTVVEHVIQHSRRTPGFHRPSVVDVCTGSGVIAIALAKHLPESRIVASDLSPDALEVARRNAQTHGVADRVAFLRGDLLEPIVAHMPAGGFRYLVSNPPYISDAEWADVAPNVRDHEPTLALRGGADGLDFIRRLLAEARRVVAPPAQVVIEIAASQKQAALDLAAASPARLGNAQVLSDHEGLPRVLVADVM